MQRLMPVVIVLTLGVLGPGARAGDEPSATAVKTAIETGATWLKAQLEAGGLTDDTDHDLVELSVLTLAHAGLNLKDKVFAEALKFLETVRLRFTYRTALLAMALSEVNPRLYRARLAHCAQWLVDTQLAGGEWGYPGAFAGPERMPDGLTVEPPPPSEAKAGEGKPGAAPPKIVIARRTSITADKVLKGDFSNTQFAILGLRACREAGIELPKETWNTALGYLRRFQRNDGGWGYVVQGQQDGASYASLTCAATCSLAICLSALGTKDVRGDTGVKKALGWLDRHLDVARNVGIDQSEVIGPSPWQYYHLYSLERAGRVLGLETLGRQPWYAAGAKWLLAAQHADGHWADGEGSGGSRPSYFTAADTCFALLFLARATRPISGS
jgi:hypothetical protein